MSTYYDQYSRDLARMNALRMRLAMQGRDAVGPSEIARRVAAGGKGKWTYAGSSIVSPPQPEHKKSLLEKIGTGIGYGLGIPIPQIKEALDTSPARAVLDLLSRGNYASADWSSEYNKVQEKALADMKAKGGGNVSDEILSWVAPLVNSEPYTAAWRGLKGEEKKTYSDVLAEQHPGMGNRSRGAAGFALDVVGDPLNLVGGGTIAKAGKLANRGTKIAKPEEILAEAVRKGEPVAESQAPIIEKVLQEAQKVEDSSAPRITVEPKQIIDTAEAGNAVDALKGVPVYAYPRDLDIPAPFREVDETADTTTKASPVVEKTEAQKRKLAQMRAVKASIMQDESHPMGKWTMGDLLKAAQKSDENAARVEKLINDEVKRLVRSGEDLPEAAQLYGRSGEKAAFRLGLPQLTDLLHKGEIGGSAKYGDADEFLGQFPIHSADDLETVFVNNSKGARVTLGTYLRDLGVELKAVNQKGGMSFLNAAELPKSIISSKTVPATRKVEKKFSPAEMINWVSTNSYKVPNKELRRLHDAKSSQEFAQILDEIRKTTRSHDFDTLDNLAKAIGAGALPDDAKAAIFKKLGVRNITELKQLRDRLLPKGTKSKVAPVAKEVKPNPKVERILGRVDPDDFGQVSKAEDIIDNKMSVSYTLPKLNEDQLGDLAQALPEAVLKNIVDPADLKKYPFMTDIKKARRTSATPGVGKGRNLHGWNQYSQSDIFRSIIKSAAKRHPIPSGATGRNAFKAWKQRAAALYDEVMPTLAAAEAALRRENVKLISGTDNSGLMLSLHDVLVSLPREVVERHLFNPRTSALPTDFIDAADAIVRSITNGNGLEVAREYAFTKFKHSPRIRTLKEADKVAGELTRALMENSDVILQRVEANYARHGIQVGKAVKSMSDDVIAKVVGKYANPNVSPGEALGDFAARGEEVSSAGRKIDAPTEAYDEARKATDVTLAGVLKPGDFAEAKATKEFAEKAATEEDATKIGKDQSASRSAEGLDVLGQTVDLGDRYNAQLQSNLFRANVPLLDKAHSVKDALGRAFVSSYGHKDLHEALRMERSVTQDFSRAHRSLIAALHDSILEIAGPNAKQYTKEAFDYLQRGITPADPTVQSIMDGLQSSLDITFGARAGGLGSFAQRNGIFAHHLNETMDFYKVPNQYRFDTSKPFMEQMDNWKTWENVDDPLSLLDGLHASMQRASVEVTLGRNFSSEFGVATPKPGYVKVKNSGSKSRIGRFIDKNMYYPAEIAKQLEYLDDVLQGSLFRIKNPNAAALVSKYDSIIHAWKSGLTIYRPGHHIRNLIGDVTLAAFDGVTNPAVYAKASRILSTRSKAYQGWDGLKALESGGAVAGGDTARVTARIVGKKRAFTDDEIYRAAYDQGLLPDYRSLEDIAFNVEQGLPSTTNKVSWKRPTGGRAQRMAGGISQARDHWIRIAHFTDVVQKGSWKSAEEAFAEAGKRVRKWHPDGSDLTNFENQVARRTFMFYSWMRKAIPLVVETIVMKPGKAMVFPKAMYNFAIANGVDPESLGNPFPVDQLFPEFITDQVLGPQFGEAGDYGGINPGEPVTEMMSQWGSSDPQHALLGAISPVGRVPIELATGTNLGTGSSIVDKSDYADSQLPGLGYISKITGTSVTGLGQPISDVSRGNAEAGFNEQALINFLTGLGIREYSKPNYIRRAQLEKRDEAREAFRSRNG